MPYASYYVEYLKRKEYRARPEVRERDVERKRELRQIKVRCGCGSIYSLPNETQHQRTIKHTKWVQNPELQKIEEEKRQKFEKIALEYEKKWAEEKRREDEAQKQYEEEKLKKQNELWGSIEPLF